MKSCWIGNQLWTAGALGTLSHVSPQNVLTTDCAPQLQRAPTLPVLQSPLGGFALTHTLVHTYSHTPAPPAPYVMATLEALGHYSVFRYLMKYLFFLSGTRTSGRSLVSLSLSRPTGRIYTLILQRPAATGWNSPCSSSSSSLPTMPWTNMDM